MTDNVTQFPIAEPEPWYRSYAEAPRVIIEGRLIPMLRARERGDEITIILDERFAIDVPMMLGRQVAWLVANALAIGAGYPHLGAESKECPFAPISTGLGEIPQ